jgi:tRNA (guanine37-N1)-methyltransferase
VTEKPGNPWTARVLTLFPGMFPGPLGESLAGTALKDDLWALETVDIRGFAGDKHATVDDAPFGGGPGMVMRPDVLGKAIDSAREAGTEDMPLIYLSPRGRRLDQQRVRALSAGSGATLICGRFEGVDQRVLDQRDVEEISLGDFVLSGGEPAALALIDAVVRLLPGVISDKTSVVEESFEFGLLEYPQYTRPREWEDQTVPKVLLSGDHEKIKAWRRDQAEAVTKERRDDLWQSYQATGQQSGGKGRTKR